MIEQLTIDGFKSIRAAVIPMSGLNILSGLNSSGKSSVIQSLRILDGIARHKDKRFVEEFGGEKELLNKHEREIGLSAYYGEGGARVIDYKNISGDNSDYPKTIYVGADRIGPKRIYFHNDTHDILPDGNNVMKCIEYYNDEMGPLPSVVIPENSEGEAFRFVVNRWLKEISPTVNFNLSKMDGMNAHFATFNQFSPVNVGFGLSYILSIIVAILMGVQEKNSIVIIENPEAHIHAKGQTALSELMCRAVEAGAQIVVETHSDHVFDGVRIYAKEHSGFAQKVKVAWFRLVKDKDSIDESFSTSIEFPSLLDNGGMEYWPEDMFSQFMNNAERLL